VSYVQGASPVVQYAHEQYEVRPLSEHFRRGVIPVAGSALHENEVARGFQKPSLEFSGGS
jgi:hypothetical protein